MISYGVQVYCFIEVGASIDGIGDYGTGRTASGEDQEAWFGAWR